MKAFILVQLLICLPLLAKVDPPNYDFSLDALTVFMPGSSVEAMTSKYGKGEIQQNNESGILYKFYVAHIRYKFPVYVQTKNNISIDFFARLPTYFLHDIFHQSLINRLGKQTQFFKKGEHSIYSWKKGKITHTYCGSCTITCFPQYYSVSENSDASKSLLKKLTKE